jgi:hypothetical protein
MRQWQATSPVLLGSRWKRWAGKSESLNIFKDFILLGWAVLDFRLFNRYVIILRCVLL